MSNTLKSVLAIITCIMVMLTPYALAVKENKQKEKNLKIIIVFSGAKDIKEKLDNLSENIEKTAKEFGTTSHIAYWDNEGQNLINKALRSEGYYSPIITSKIDEDVEKYKNYTITFEVFPANQYLLADIEIVHAGDSNKDITLPDIKNLPTKINSPAKAESLLNNQAIILQNIEQDNCLLSLSVHNEATINHREDNISVRYVVKAGPVAEIKEVDFEGMSSISKEYIQKVVQLKPGTCYKGSKISKARERLQRTGLFASTTPDVPGEVDEAGRVPVIFKLKERKHRSVKAGISYGTDLGAGISTGWEHRNLFSNGEELSAEAFLNQKEQFGSVRYIKPYFLLDNQKLVGKFTADNKTNKAFDSKEGKLSLGVERELENDIDVGIAGALTLSRIKEKANIPRISKQAEDFVLISIPAYVGMDKRDNVVNSSKGYYIRATVEPFYDLKRNDNAFMKNTVETRYYITLDSRNKSVLAVRGRIGSMLGDNASDIPATERFYLGGSQSLRGYALQTVGPYDINRNIPIGGKSFLEGAVEYRYTREDNIGFAIFYEIGNVYRKHAPDFKDKKMFASSGFGLRYDTDFGPLRADIAFPMNRRKGIDDRFQFSIGIGQSF